MGNNNELAYLWVVAPILGSWLVTLFVGKVKDSSYVKPWFSIGNSASFGIWTVLYLILGLILYRSFVEDDTLLFYFLIALVLTTYLWLYTFAVARNPTHSLYLIVIMIVLALLVYTELFYSNTVSNDTPDSLGKGYIFLFIPFIVWLLFALVLSSHTTQRVSELES